MKRRGFLGFLGAALAAAAITPTKLLNLVEPLPEVIAPGGWVSYRFIYTVTIPPAANYRLRYIETYENIPSVL